MLGFQKSSKKDKFMGLMYVFLTVTTVMFAIVAMVGVGSMRIIITLVGVLGIAAGFAVFFFLHSQERESSWPVTETTSIVSLGDSTRTNGNGGLLYVVMEEDDVYQFMVKNEDGSMSLETIETDDVKIFEDVSKSEAKLETLTCSYESPFERALWGSCGQEYAFHVPAGSVTKDFVVDVTE